MEEVSWPPRDPWQFILWVVANAQSVALAAGAVVVALVILAVVAHRHAEKKYMRKQQAIARAKASEESPTPVEDS